MTISSTEFQQNVGKYLAMAEKGIPVIVERKKPKASRFRLAVEKNEPSKTNREKQKEFCTWLNDFQKLERIQPAEDAVVFQRRVRS